MENNLPPLPESKLTVLCRVEPGCLGPDGKEYIEGFCRFAFKEMKLVLPSFVQWLIIPRYDKTLPEIQYKLRDRNLTTAQATKLLEIFNKDTNEIESDLDEILADLIEQYLDKH